MGLGMDCILLRRLYRIYSLLIRVMGRFVRMDRARMSVARWAETIASSCCTLFTDESMSIGGDENVLMVGTFRKIDVSAYCLRNEITNSWSRVIL